MNLLRNALAIAILCATGVQAATLAEAELRKPTNQFYSNKAEGWYWYQDPDQQEIVQLEPVVEPPATPESKSETQTEPPTPKLLSLKWVQEMLPKYMEKAWDNPTPENVEAYFLLQRYVMDKANRFSDVAQQVVVGNALIDETARRPLSSFAVRAVEQETQSQSDRTLKRIAQKAGIFFFFKSDCKYCEIQAPVLGFLEEYGFHIMAISVDGGTLQRHQFKDTRRDGGHAQLLGVRSTPSIFLMDEDGKFTAISQGVLSYPELKNRILLVAAREGWISQEEFQLTQPLVNQEMQRNLVAELPNILETMAKQAQQPEDQSQTQIPTEKLQLPDSGFIEPAVLLAAMKQPQNTSIQTSNEE